MGLRLQLLRGLNLREWLTRDGYIKAIQRYASATADLNFSPNVHNAQNSVAKSRHCLVQEADLRRAAFIDCLGVYSPRVEALRVCRAVYG